MLSRLTIRFAGVSVLAFVSVSDFASGAAPRQSSIDAPRPVAEPRYRFERNDGQADGRWACVAHGRGLTQLVGAAESEFVVAGGTVRLRFEDVSAAARCTARRTLPGTSAYLIGNDRSRWLRGIPQSADVGVAALYDGVDLLWRDSGRGEPEYDLALAAGRDAAAIRFRVDGGATRITADGSLVTTVPGGELRQSRPVAFQDDGGRRTRVDAAFVATGDSTFGFALGVHDAARPVVIDPEIQFSSYLGGDDLDYAASVAVDPTGATYVLGTTISADFPTQPHVARTFPGHASDVFVAKFAPDGASLVWSVYVGGTMLEYPGGLCVDATGRASVACRTQSDDFPTVNAAFGTAPNHGPYNNTIVDVGLFRLDAAGADFDFATYLGGTGDDLPVGVGLVPGGDLWVGGTTSSADFPLKSPLQAQPGGNSDFFLTRFDSAGALVSSTTLGGSGSEVAKCMAVAADGTVALAGFATGPTQTFGPGTLKLGPMTNAANIAVVTVAPSGSLGFEALIGGTNSDAASGVALDGAGAVYLTGTTQSADLPLLHPLLGRFRGSNAYIGGAFALKLASDGALVWSTFLEAPSGALIPECLTVDAQGGASLAGRVGWFTRSGEQDAPAIVRLTPAGDRIYRFDQLPRTPGFATIRAIAFASGGRAVVAGEFGTTALPGPRTVQSEYAGKTDGFVMRIGLPVVTAKKVKIQLDFRRTGHDVIRVKGVSEAPSLPSAGSDATIDVGGVSRTFTLDAKGRGSVGGDSIRLRFGRKGATFAVTLRGDFAALLADEGLTGDATLSHAARSAAISLEQDGASYTGSLALSYSSKAGVRGSAVRRPE